MTHTYTSPIEQIFLDINEKARKLDDSDVFKAHCYKNYGNMFPDELQAYWVRLKKASAQFSKWGFKNFDEYIYTYILLTIDKTLPHTLSKSGNHILTNKSMDYTEKLLKSMAEYGESVIKYHENVTNTDYDFSDICINSSDYRGSGFIPPLKQLSSWMITNCKTQYPKLPFFYFIYKLSKFEEVRAKFDFITFQNVVTNLFIYSILYAYTDLKRAKSMIDQRIYECLNKIPEEISVDEIRRISKELRKETINHFSIPSKETTFKNLAIIYTIMDQFILNDCRISETYTEANNYNLEHFLIPDNRGLKVIWKNGVDGLPFKLASKYKDYKKRTINYLIMDKDLNQEMQN